MLRSKVFTELKLTLIFPYIYYSFAKNLSALQKLISYIACTCVL